MKLSHELIVNILRPVPASNEGSAGMHLIVKRPYDHLLKELQGVFGGQGDVEITIDNRRGERRTGSQPFAPDRRQGDRSKETEPLLEVVLAA